MANNDLPVRRMTIKQYVNLLLTLLQQKKTAEFVLATLSGKYRGEQITVDALENRIYNAGDSDNQQDPALYGYRMVCDIDSLLGLSENICVVGQYIVFYVLPRFRDALSKDVGIQRTISVGGVCISLCPLE